MYKPSIGLREAKANLSRLIKEVKEGAEIILTERGKPVAKLTPVGKDTLSLEQRIAHLEHSGWIEPPASKKRKLSNSLPLHGNIAQKFLQEDRNT